MDVQSHDSSHISVDVWSSFVRRTLHATPKIRTLAYELSLAPINEQVIQAQWLVWKKDIGPSFSFAQALRLWRNTIMVALAQRSLLGNTVLIETLQAVSSLAAQSIQIAINHCGAILQEQYGTPLDSQKRPQDLLVVGMGKLGANELNVSSDIDLVLVYREQGETTGNSAGQGVIAASEFFTKLIRQLLPLLEASVDGGFVFRVDLRLRPHGDAGPVAVSLGYLEDYLQAEGRAWERFAWLKAHVVAHTRWAEPQRAQMDINSLTAVVEPFVFRRYMDFAAIASLRDLHQLIQNEHRKKQIRKASGVDVKLGRGGIREIEFSVQLLQIIRAGRDTKLRDRNTLLALQKLADAKQIGAEQRNSLEQAYSFLRRLENAIQWRDDQQTHWIDTEDTAQLIDLSGFMGTTPTQLISDLSSHRAVVRQVFDSFTVVDPDSDRADTNTIAVSAEGQGNGQGSLERHPLEQALLGSARFTRASEQTQSIIHYLLGQVRQTPALPAVVALFEKIVGRPGYLALLYQYPRVFARLCRLLSHSSWAARFVASYPIVLDELLSDPTDQRLNWETLQADLNLQLKQARLPAQPEQNSPYDTERQIDLLREFHHTVTLRILLQELDGHLTVKEVADDLSALADTIITQALIFINEDSAIDPLKSGFAVIAYGKLGGKEMGYASDLDLVFIVDETRASSEQNAEPIVFAMRLARKLIHWLTIRTGAGELFDVDLRLRPDGESGQSVVSLTAFADYQKTRAWLWEHQALTRARFCAGDSQVKNSFEAVRQTILTLQRDPKIVAQEVSAMRTKVLQGHPNRTALFDLKHDRGGMVDLEFCVQYLILSYAHQYPELTKNLGNLALLEKSGQLGLIQQSLAERCSRAYAAMRRAQYNLRLNDQTHARQDPLIWQEQRLAIQSLWAQLFDSSK